MASKWSTYLRWRAFRPGAIMFGPPGTDVGAAGYVDYNWENYNRNKRSISIDLAQPEGAAIVRKLISEADVLVTNLRLFEREKFGLGYETLHKLHPRLLYGSLTAWRSWTTGNWSESGHPPH